MTEKTMHVVSGADEQPRAVALLTLWQQQPAADQAPLTVRRYAGALRRFLAWYAEEEGRLLTVSDLHPITLAGYRGALQHAAATSTVNTHLCALRTWCAWLHAQGYLAANPAARLKLVGRQEPAAPRALTPAQVNALLRAAQRTRYPARNTAILQILVQTGLRIGECAALCWGDLAVGEKRGQVRVRAGKGNKARTVPLNDSARQALAEYAAPLLAVEPTVKAVAAAWPFRHDRQRHCGRANGPRR
jgi:site-specific recombinase XerD